MKAWYILLFLAAAMFVATASAEISGHAVVNDGNVAYTATAALGGSVDVQTQEAGAHDGAATASQETSASGEQVVAVTGAISSEGDSAVTVAAVQDGGLTTSQNALADDDYVNAGQNSQLVGEAGIAFTTAEDCMGDSATTVAGFEDGKMSTSQGAEARELPTIQYGGEAAVAYTGRWVDEDDDNKVDEGESIIGTTIDADSGYVETYATDRFGITAGTYIAAEGNHFTDSDMNIQTIQLAEAGDSAGVHFVVENSPFVINTVKGAESLQISHAKGKEIEAGSYAEDANGASSYTGIETKGGFIKDAELNTFQVAGADLFKTGVLQISEATGRHTETITVADNDGSWWRGDLKKVIIEGESGRFSNGNVVTTQGAATSSVGPFSFVGGFAYSTPGAFTNWDSETTTVFAAEHDVDHEHAGTGAGDHVFQGGWIDWDDHIMSFVTH